jgi:tetratricopeptide (TPR) repeat protein
VDNSVPPPSLTGPIIISSSSLPADAQAVLRSDEQTTISQLKAAPTREDLWLQLGVDRKIGGDYAGAEVAWNYVAQTGPTTITYVAYGDLGDLYSSFDVNHPKAEADYKAAIAINPKVIDYYRELFYLYGMDNNPTAQSAILAQGLKANPTNPDLLQLQKQ